jgi:heptosyltransferase-2
VSARYLIVKLAALGDVAMASALPEAIRRREPDARITWLCGGRVAELVRLFDGVSEVLTVDEVRLLRGRLDQRIGALLSVWRELAFRRFDAILMAHADRRYRSLVLPARAGHMRSLEHAPSPRMLPIPGRYYGDEYVRLLDDGGSRGPIVGHSPLSDVRSRLPARRDSSAVGVVLVPGGTRNVLRESALRRWPVERYRAVAERLLDAGHEVTLIGDAGDAWVRPSFVGVGVRDEIGAHGLGQTLAVMAAADLVISHDTGPLHLAQLVRAPLLALFGPTMPSQFVLDDTPATQVIWGGATLACRPCYDGREFAACRDNLCMQDIPVSAVANRALAMLAAGRRPRLAPTLMES